jgi:dihydrofolate reductase
MRLVAVVAVADNGVIGKDGGMPWHLPADLAHFKRATLGKPVIMGRRTWESIGKALPGRVNVVVSTTLQPEGALRAGSLDEALALPEVREAQEVMIIGGATLYEQALHRCDEVVLTRIHAAPEGDTFFHFDPTGWELASREERAPDEKNAHPLSFERWVRRR